MNDRAVANLCQEWLAIYKQALPCVDSADGQLQKQFWRLYEGLEIRARSLVSEAAARSLDSLPLSSLPSSRPKATSCTVAEREAFFAAGKAVSILLRVVETESAPDKRKLVALIHRFLVEVGDYLKWANLIATNAVIHKQGRRTLREMSLGQGVVLPSQDDLDHIVELDLRKNEARATLAETGRNLAKELVQHGFKADGILKVIHRADGGGGGPSSVAEIWESVKIDLQGNLITLASGNGRHEPTTAKQPRRARQSRKLDRATEARDKWIYKQCCDRVAYDTIASRLNDKPRTWVRISGVIENPADADSPIPRCRYVGGATAARIPCPGFPPPRIMRPCQPSRPMPRRRSAGAAGFSSACGR